MDSIEELKISADNQFPELPSLSTLVINDAAKMKDLSGVEKFPKLEVIDFSQNSNFSSLANLAKLSELREIKNGRRLRGGLVDEGSCPEGIEAPWGLRDFCRNLQVPFGTNLGPLPF
ncbi:MAG TPA: hypothetical protein VFO10_18760 [Oligoflexus sp.]|uniref:hypothetical protein n=1 Tax=Oligoflexus sp. TaxID=1971216 RepID=UPI002D7F06CD|nr:hypothetical protein [Oligoflexus sp.]HET9239309.1 hypothetical protein [Oligoflexus sp.]